MFYNHLSHYRIFVDICMARDLDLILVSISEFKGFISHKLMDEDIRHDGSDPWADITL